MIRKSKLHSEVPPNCAQMRRINQQLQVVRGGLMQLAIRIFLTRMQSNLDVEARQYD
jgi:hypothetical protein